MVYQEDERQGIEGGESLIGATLVFSSKVDCARRSGADQCGNFLVFLAALPIVGLYCCVLVVFN